MEMILDTRDRLERGRVMGRKLYNGFLVILAIVAILVIAAEAIGALTTNWIAPIGYSLLGFYSLASVVVSRRKTEKISEMRPAELLKHAIERAQNNLLLARSMYAVYPGGVFSGIVGGLALSGVIFDRSKLDGMPSWAVMGYLVIALSSVPVSIYFGMRLAKRQQIALKELRARLQSLESGTT